MCRDDQSGETMTHDTLVDGKIDEIGLSSAGVASYGFGLGIRVG
jgi:hypothetical protein